MIPTPTGWPAAWTDWQAGDVRVIVTTGVNCPDRGVSHQTVILGRGWDWVLRGGTARYTGTTGTQPSAGPSSTLFGRATPGRFAT